MARNLTIEEIKVALQRSNTNEHVIDQIILAIVSIRTEGYDEGWDDALAEFQL